MAKATKARKPGRGSETRKEVARMIADLTPEQRAKITAGMVVSIEGHGFSWHNTVSILVQRPNATVVAGFRQWIARGRCVCKGERGSMIFLPMRKGEDPNVPADAPDNVQVMGDKVRFLTAYVWDISQTRELEEGERGERPRSEEPEGEEAPEPIEAEAVARSGRFTFETVGAAQ